MLFSSSDEDIIDDDEYNSILEGFKAESGDMTDTGKHGNKQTLPKTLDEMLGGRSSRSSSSESDSSPGDSMFNQPPTLQRSSSELESSLHKPSLNQQPTLPRDTVDFSYITIRSISSSSSECGTVDYVDGNPYKDVQRTYEQKRNSFIEVN